MIRAAAVPVRRTLAVFLGLLVLVAAAQAWAAKPRVGVPVFQGAGEGPIRAKVVKALKANGYQIVGGKQLKATASSAGVNLDNNDGFAAVAKELAISAFVAGDVGKKKATLTVRNGADGSVLGEASFAGPKPAKIKAAVAAGFWRRLGSAVSKGTPPSGAKTKTTVAEEAEPADTEDKEDSSGGDEKSSSTSSSEKESDSSSSGGEEAGEERHPAPRRRETAKAKDKEPEESSSVSTEGLKALQIGLGGKAFWRKLTPHDDPSTALSTYSISPGGALVLWLEAFPAAFSSTGGAANIGLVGGLDKGLAISSKTADGSTSFTTNYLAWNIGLKLRLPLGTAVPFLAIRYGEQAYKLEPKGGANRPTGVLDTDFKYVDATLGTSFLVSPSFALDLNASLLYVLSPGSLITSAQYFKNAKAMGVDLGASAVFYVTPMIGVRAGLDFRQYGLDFKVTSANAPLVVGGATDRYVSIWGGLEIAFDAAGGASAEPTPPPAPRKAAPKPTSSDE